MIKTKAVKRIPPCSKESLSLAYLAMGMGYNYYGKDQKDLDSAAEVIAMKIEELIVSKRPQEGEQ